MSVTKTKKITAIAMNVMIIFIHRNMKPVASNEKEKKT